MARWQEDLQRRTCVYPETYVFSQYRDLASDQDIQDFLDSEPLWDSRKKEWITVAKAASLEALRASVMSVVQAIIARLGRRGSDTFAKRTVSSSCGKPLPHLEYYPTKEGSCPPLVIKAIGPSFEDPLAHTGDSLAYTNVASYLNIIDNELILDDKITYSDDSAVYARYFHLQIRLTSAIDVLFFLGRYSFSNPTAAS